MTPSSPQEAEATAATAATAAGVTIEAVADPAAATAARDVLDRVWGRTDGSSVLGVEALLALTHAGGQVSLARDRTSRQPVGATAAWLGSDHDGGTWYLHSHATGVLTAAAGRGIGRALKWHQRAWCLARGLTEVRWTFDPLIRRNAVVNLLLLGAGVRAYKPDIYGAMTDERNRGLPTDRLVASWRLDAPRVVAAAAGRATAPDIGALRGSGATVLLDEDEVTGGPRPGTADGAPLLVRVPTDIEHLRATDPATATAWCEALRASLGAQLMDGARVAGISRDGWYVLSGERSTTELL